MNPQSMQQHHPQHSMGQQQHHPQRTGMDRGPPRTNPHGPQGAPLSGMMQQRGQGLQQQQQQPQQQQQQQPPADAAPADWSEPAFRFGCIPETAPPPNA